MKNKSNYSKKKEEKHKYSGHCFNKCVEWKLTASISQNKTSLGYIFVGKSLFYKKLEASVLNTLQNNYVSLQSDRSNSKNVMKEFEDKSNNQWNEKKGFKIYDDQKDNDILNTKFPIDNSDFNFMIIDANLSMSENLNNIFFLEFDLTSSLINKEKLKFLREINNETVDREIFFVLNGTIHGTTVFKSEISFSVETRKFIKSIQFKLETYKNDLCEKSKNMKNSSSSNMIKNTFYTKILSNTNIGIEFYKPSFEPNYHNFPTNFNSIVNSNILINKIYLEVCIPKIFISNGLTLNITNKYKEQKVVVKEKENLGIPSDRNIPIVKNLKIAELNNPNNFKNNSEVKSPNKKALSPLSRNRNGSGYNSNTQVIRSPEFTRKNVTMNYLNFNSNEPNRVFVNPRYPVMPMSPNSMNTSIYNNNRPFTINNSINSTTNTYHSNNSSIQLTYNRSNSNGNLLKDSNLENHSNINTNNIKKTINSTNYRRFSESTYDNLSENPLSSMMNFNKGNPFVQVNMNIRSPPIAFKVNPDMIIPNVNLMNMNSSFGRNVQNSFTNFSLSNQGYHTPLSCQDIYENYHSNLNDQTFSGYNIADNNFYSKNYYTVLNSGFISPRGINENYSTKSENSDYMNLSINRKIKTWEIKNLMDTNKSKNINDQNNNTKFQTDNLDNLTYSTSIYSEDFLPKSNNIENIETNRRFSVPQKLMQKRTNIQTFINHYDGLCNFLIFIRACTPHIYKRNNNLLKKIDLEQCFKSFEKTSAFGLDIPYFYNNDILFITYSPTISAIEINVSDLEIIKSILEELFKINKHINDKKKTIEDLIVCEENNDKNKSTLDEYFIGDSNMKLTIRNKTIRIEYYETRPPHSRQILIKQIDQIFENLPLLKLIPINKINNSAWFSILWSPVKSTRGIMNQTSFLVYYQFNLFNMMSQTNRESEVTKLNINNSNNNFIQIPIIGLLPIKFDTKFYLSKIYRNIPQNNNVLNMQYNQNQIYNETSNQYHILLKNSIENVFNLMVTNNSRSSVDYEFYLKNSISL